MSRSFPRALVQFSFARAAFGLALLAVCACSAPATAGLISIQAAPLSANGAQISTLGQTVAAWNVHGNAVTPPTIAGITFPNDQPSQIALAGFGGTGTDQAATGNHYTGAMVELMNDMRATNGGSPGSVTFSGLNVGQLYQVQFLHLQDVNNNSIRDTQVHFGPNLSDPNTGFFFAGDNQGYITTARFLADATSQVFRFTTGGGGDRAVLNAVALTTVPEPSSLALGAMGLVGLYFVARRRR